MSDNQSKPQQGNLNKPPVTDPIDAGLQAAAARAAAEAMVKEGDARNAAALSGKAQNHPSDLRHDRIETSDFEIQDAPPIGLEEIRRAAHASLDVEPITGVQMSEDAIKLEAFMNEKVIVVVHESTNEEDLEVIQVMVNGISQIIVRGYPTPVKRKYIEALARAKETKYKQVQKDASDPSSLVMVPRSALAYPFAIERDDNPNGRAWLRDLIKQQA